MGAIRVLIVDDHPLMREALAGAIESASDMEVVGVASGGWEAVAQAQSLQPDVVVMDLLMPDVDGVEAIEIIRDRMPHTSILAITSSTEEGKVLEAVQAGALGYLLKNAERDELLQAIREVSQGRTYLPPQVALKLVHSLHQRGVEDVISPEQSARDRSLALLTERQREVLHLLGQGMSNQEIAHTLGLGDATVRSHIYRIMGRLNLQSRTQAIAYAVRRGLLDAK
ncbi:MAG: response regulator transcription factor [Caldilineaceae bacterium]|nr:response regulator transcription factor [Caldilineaceae bacterium]